MVLQDQIKKTIRDVPDFPKKGILFKDVTPVFENQELCNSITSAFIDGMKGDKPDAVVGIESRGFLFGILMANKLNVPFVLIRKEGKLPAKKIKESYELEYGSAVIEMHEGSIKNGWKVLIHDDLLATGGTAEAAARLIQKQGASVLAFQFLVGLDFLNGKNKLNNYTNNIQCLVQY